MTDSEWVKKAKTINCDRALALQKLISDINYVAEFGHPAIDRKDDAAALEWIRGEIERFGGNEQ